MIGCEYAWDEDFAYLDWYPEEEMETMERYEVHEHFHPQQVILRTDDVKKAFRLTDERPGRWVIDTMTNYYATRLQEEPTDVR